MILHTDRLLLREFEADDWQDVYAYSSDPEVARFMFFDPGTEAQARNFVHSKIVEAQEQPRRIYELVIVLKEENRVIGGITLARAHPEATTGNFSYLLNRAYWGRGYATEALRALLQFGFEVLRLHRLTDNCDPENIASARVMQKCGLRQEGHLRESAWIGGEWRDELVYAILDHEWQPR